MNKLKKPVSLLLTLLLLLSVAAAAPVSVSADDATVYTEGNYQYTVSKKKATIVKYIGHAKKVVVPSTLGGYPVTCIGSAASSGSYYSVFGSEGGTLGGSSSVDPIYRPNDYMESVVIPESVKIIGYRAFRYCTKLADVKICNGVEELRKEAFNNCWALKKIVLPDSIKVVDKDSLWQDTVYGSNYYPWHLGVEELTMNTDNCVFDVTSLRSSLLKITITPGTKRIPDNAFTEFEYLNSISIPNTVEYIGERAFYTQYYDPDYFPRETFLTSIDIPGSVQFIGKEAFTNYEYLEEVKLHKGLKSIGEGAFSGCIRLSHIILPRTLQCIGKSAFQSCYSITSIDIPGSVGVVSENAFKQCTSLSTVVLHRGVTGIALNAFNKNIINTNVGTLDIYIPMSVANISVSTPQNPSMSQTISSENYDHTEHGGNLSGSYDVYRNDACIHAPEGSLGESYAEACGINFSKTSDGDTVFDDYKDEDDLAAEEAAGGGNNMLSDLNTFKGILGGLGGFDEVQEYVSADFNLEIPDSINNSPVKDIAANAFRNLDIKSIGFPNSIENIGPWAFNGCKKLGQATLNAGVQELGEYAFANCPKLTDVELPNSVTTLGSSVFSSCKKLEDIELPDGLTTLSQSAFEGCSSLNRIEIPDSFTSISKGLLRNCTSLTDIELPSSLSRIGNTAFSACKSLSGLDIPSSLSEIKDSVFTDCINLDDIELPDGLTELGNAAFGGCDGLKEIDLPDTITSIGDAAFENCKNLESIELSDSITSIGSYVFDNCSSLNNVELPEGVTSIGKEAFRNCDNLSNLVIPASVNNISTDAFNGCDQIIISGYSDSYAEDFADDHNIPFVGYTTSGGKATIDTYNVPDYFGNVAVLPEFYDKPVTRIGDDVFKDLTTMSNVELPDSITNIGDRAFSGCTNLDNISLPDGIKTIEDSAFLNCSSLTELSVPSGAESVEQNAFKGCANLKEAYIWGRGTAVGSDAFKNCEDDLTIYAYDSSPADTYASGKDVDFVPLLNTNDGGSYKDVPLTNNQSTVDDGNTFGLNQETYGNIEFLGIQQKNDQGCGIRFVGVINEGIVAEATRSHDVDDYGFVVAKCSKSSTAATSEENIKTITVGSSNALTLSCKNTSNQICGDYGVYNADTKYKYVTLAVNNVNPEQGLVARFYVKTKSGRVYYANYGEEHTGCVTDYNRIAAMSSGDNSVLIRDEWDGMSTLSND